MCNHVIKILLPHNLQKCPRNAVLKTLNNINSSVDYSAVQFLHEIHVQYNPFNQYVCANICMCALRLVQGSDGRCGCEGELRTAGCFKGEEPVGLGPG